MNITRTLLLAASLSVAGAAADAAILGFDFEDANNGWKIYEKDGYMFDPSNLNSSTRCADDGPNPKHCFLETTQGDPTVLSPDLIDDATEDAERYHDGEFTEDEEFDLLAFYINFQGTGANDDNTMWLYDQDIAFDDELETWSGTGEILAFTLDAAADSFEGLDIYLAGDVGSGPLGADHLLSDQIGYIVVIQEGYFEGINTFTWNASNGANNRVDCVYIGTNPEDKANFNVGSLFAEGCGAPTIIPVPPSLPLMAAGLGILGVLGRRKMKKAA
ncbi:MAG: hypothetical protein GKR98_10815 [Boseongicola sp.]|nr:MAG: hypothetical protein GKR98_10815 [Boseongicola sp.]